MSHTYVLLELTEYAYNEIKHKLKQAGYHHAINDRGEIDMHGLAVSQEDADQLTIANFKKVHDRTPAPQNGCQFDRILEREAKITRCINPKHWKFISAQKGD